MRNSQKRRNVAGTGKADPELFRAALEQAGIEQFVLVTLPRRKDMQQPHEFIADVVAQYPGRAVGLASVNPTDKGRPDEFERAITSMGCGD